MLCSSQIMLIYTYYNITHNNNEVIALEACQNTDIYSLSGFFQEMKPTHF